MTSRWTPPVWRACSSDWMPGDGLLTLGINSRNVGASSISATGVRGNLTVEQAKRDWDAARALGLPITLHTSGASPITALEKAGMLGPDVQLVHPMLTTPEERAIMKTRGMSYSISPAAELRRVVQARRHPVQRAPGGRRQDQSLDRPQRQLQLRPVRQPAPAVRAASAPGRQRQGAADDEAPGAARHASTAPSISASPTRPARSRRQARRYHPGAHHRPQHGAGRRSLRRAGDAWRTRATSTP